MRINAITTGTNSNNKHNTNFKGSVDYRELNRFITMLPNRIIKDISATEKDLQKTTTIIDKLRIKMEKFSSETKLSFRKKTEKEYEVFMEHPHSHYKQLFPNMKLSERGSAIEDLEAFEKMADNVENTNQFDVELKFCQMRFEGIIRDEFNPKL